jgi:hypothetical protein
MIEDIHKRAIRTIIVLTIIILFGVVVVPIIKDKITYYQWGKEVRSLDSTHTVTRGWKPLIDSPYTKQDSLRDDSLRKIYR